MVYTIAITMIIIMVYTIAIMMFIIMVVVINICLLNCKESRERGGGATRKFNCHFHQALKDPPSLHSLTSRRQDQLH